MPFWPLFFAAILADESGEKRMTICDWAQHHPEMTVYHNEEWGRLTVRSEADYFELLTLEGAQAGLSWRTVLNKREGYRTVFHHFNLERCANLSDEELEAARLNAAIVRNKLKIYSVRKNARALQQIIVEYGSIEHYLRDFFAVVPLVNHWKMMRDIPSESTESQAISKDLKKRGCSFIGPTIIYAFLQATGFVDDHLITCPYHSTHQNTNQK